MDIARISAVMRAHGYEATPATDAASVSGQKSSATAGESITIDSGGGMLWTRTERQESAAGDSVTVGGHTYEVLTQVQRDSTVRYQAGGNPAPLTFLSPAPTTTAPAALPPLDQALDAFLRDMAALPPHR